MSQPLRVLVVEDSEDDALLLLRMLRRGGYEPDWERVDTPEELRAALLDAQWDIVLSDFSMPSFTGLDALREVREHDPDVPFILVSGQVGEETAVEAMRAGAQDYMMKGALARLAPAVTRELADAANRRERRRTEAELQASQHFLRHTVEHSPAFIYVYSLNDFTIVYANPASTRTLGYSVQESLHRDLRTILDPEDWPTVEAAHRRLLAGPEGMTVEYECRVQHRDGAWRWLFTRESVFAHDEAGAPIRLIGNAVDVTARKQAEQRLSISNRLIEIGNRHQEMTPMLEEMVAELRSFSHCEAVGIRLLDQEGNIPYEAYAGFERSFYEDESPLSIKRDQCMCISVVTGRTDPSQPFFTAGGSFYMNGTTRFLATVSEEDKGTTRNVCNQVGYESVALIPITMGGEIIGLIHLADRRENMVPLELVDVLEELSRRMGIAIARAQAHTAVDRSEAQLREASVYTRSLIEATLDPLVTIDAEGHVTDVNRATEKMTGISREQLIGTDFSDYFTNPQEARAAYQEAFRRGESRDRELEIRDPEGRVRPVLYNAAVYRDEAGSIRGVVSAARDVSALREAEERLRENQAFLQNMVDVTPDLILVYDHPDQTVQYVNSRSLAILGYRSEELEGLSGGMDALMSHPEDAETVRFAQQGLGRAADGEVVQSEVRMRRKDGEWRWVAVRATPLSRDDDGLVMQALATARDVTERRRSEEAMRRYVEELLAFNAMGDIINESITTDELLRRAMEEVLRLVGLDVIVVRLRDPLTEGLAMVASSGLSDEALRNSDVNAPEAPAPVVVALQQARPVVIDRDSEAGAGLLVLRQRLDITSAAVIPLMGGSGPVGVMTLGSPISGFFDEAQLEFLMSLGRQIAVGVEKDQLYEEVVAARDNLENEVQERTRELVRANQSMLAEMLGRLRAQEKTANINRELEAAVEELRAANRELETFNYSASHDLRQPLGIIQNLLEALEEDYGESLAKGGHEIIRAVLDNTSRMRKLIDDLLAFSRVGRTRMQPHYIDIGDLARSTFDMLTAGNGGRRVELRVSELPPAKGDLTLLQQVFANLIGNALKFTRPSKTAVIEVGGGIAGNGQNLYWVKDNGVGFDMQFAQEMFEVFRRLHSDEDFEGTGVGLAIVQRIIERHGGRIWAEGEPGVGATFYFTLPPASEDTPEEE